MTTVLHVIDTGGPGGAETVYLNTSAGLDRARFRSICVISRDDWLARELRARNIEPIILPARGSINVAYLRRLLQIVREHSVDIIAAHLYGSAVYCGLAGFLTGTPVVSVLHGQSDVTKSGRLQHLKKMMVRRSRRVIFVSDKLRAELGDALGMPRSLTEVIPNGVDLTKFSAARDDSLRRELGLNETAILVGAVGNIRTAKAYDVLLRAAHILRAASERYHFVIAGEGGGVLQDQLLAQRKQLGLERTVTFLGLRRDVTRVLHNLNCYALSSNTEGFSIACVEAMAAGVPVVATRCGGPEEIIEHEMSGLLVPTRDPDALAAAIAQVTNDPLLAGRLRSRARERAAECYSLDRMIRSYERLFDSVLTADSGTNSYTTN